MSVTSGQEAGAKTGTQTTKQSGKRAGRRAAPRPPAASEAPGEPESTVDPEAAAARELAAARAGRLADLCHELEGHGLRYKLLGTDGSMVRAVHPGTGRTAIVLATPATPDGQEGWSYLWSGGGMADAAAPARAAEEIARALG